MSSASAPSSIGRPLVAFAVVAGSPAAIRTGGVFAFAFATVAGLGRACFACRTGFAWRADVLWRRADDDVVCGRDDAAVELDRGCSTTGALRSGVVTDLVTVEDDVGGEYVVGAGAR